MEENEKKIEQTALMVLLINLYQSRDHMSKLPSNACSLIAVDHHIHKLEKRLIELLKGGTEDGI